MNRLRVNAIRTFLAGLGSFAVLRYSYRDVRVPASSYAVVCLILAVCCLPGWLMRWRGVRVVEFLSSATVAFAASLGLILLSENIPLVDGMPWQDFYKDDYIAVFLVIAPVTSGLLCGLLSMIPEQTTA